MEDAFLQLKYEQQACICALLDQPDDWLNQHQLLNQATLLYLQLRREFCEYPPAVALRLELTDLVDTALPPAALGQHLLRLLA